MNSYPLAESSWGEEEIQAIQKVIDSNIFSMGQYVKQFEDDFAKFFGSKYAIMVNSGSSANLIAIAASFYTKNPYLKRGDEVIVPAVSWSTTYYPLQQYGLKCKFVDVDIDTLNFDIEALKEAITDNTKAIFAVNLLGNPNDFETIESMIKDKNILLIEDNCESMGAKQNGKYAGTFGKMGTFSTFFSHHMATMEGGVVVTDDKELYHVMLTLRAHGWTRNLPKENLVTGIKSDNPFEESFKFVLPGYNLRPLEMSGAIGIEQLKKLPDFIKHRQINAKKFVELFKDSKYFEIQKEIGDSSWFGFSFILKEDCPFNRAELVSFLQDKNIDCRPIVAGNFVNNDVLKHFDYVVHNNLENAYIVDSRGLFVGNHHYEMNDLIDYLYNSINEFFREI